MARSAKPRAAASAKPSASGVLFSRGWVGTRDLVWVLAHDDPDSGQRTRVMQRRGDQWVQRIVGWGGVAITAQTAPDVKVFAVGADGQVLIGQRSGFADEHVDPSANGPERHGAIRDARMIGDDVLAVGMCRQAYRRDPRGTWRHIDQGILVPPQQHAGLNGVDGFSAEDVYAVGLGGELWHFDGQQWQRIDSPTNVMLQRVRCVAPGLVYVCGGAGTLLRIDPNGVDTVAPEATDANLYGLAWFAGKLYIAALKGLYVLEEDDLLPVDVGLGSGITFGDLHANDGVLWSLGARHLLRSDDGVRWTQVFYP